MVFMGKNVPLHSSWVCNTPKLESFTSWKKGIIFFNCIVNLGLLFFFLFNLFIYVKLARLKKYLKTKKNYLVCKNEGCGAKYGTAQGFLVHQKICGVKEEEREKFVCDLCGKEYITMPGLTYHMNTKHAQVKGLHKF